MYINLSYEDNKIERWCILMTKNSGVKCSVQQCKHNENEQYCNLQTIQIGTHEQNPKMDQCTDCQSFELK
ncbi:MAG: DUF1540 domain-containing protein [Clostridium sp.]|uniref:DUF1540 domain-containing protein n=2 Tax=Clostridium culturomicium TaxID=1499683 RepID=UPI00290B9CA1|nr:DUF1540 domain-containing protein [Clostridium sp.]MDU7083690.1 DUF1540 domain-containing protein [Clostridium sp.]